MRIVYALLCYASIIPIAIHALHTTQKALHKQVDLAWQASEYRWLHKVYHSELGPNPNIDEHIRNARPILDVDSFQKISPHSGKTIKHLNKLIESNNIDELAYTCHRFWAEGHSANLSGFDGTDATREPLAKAIMLQHEECVSLLVAFGASSSHETIASGGKETIISIPKVLRATQSANIITTALLLQHGASPYARKMSTSIVEEEQEESGYFDHYGVFHRDTGKSFDCYEVYYYHESCLHAALESNAPGNMLDLLLRYSAVPTKYWERNTVYGAPYPILWKHDDYCNEYDTCEECDPCDVYENNSLITKAFTCETTRPLKTLLDWGADPNAKYNAEESYLLDLVEPIVRSSVPQDKQDTHIKAIYRALLKYGARECTTTSRLRDEALDMLIHDLEVSSGIKGEACVICLPPCGRSASSVAPYTLCKKHRKKNH